MRWIFPLLVHSVQRPQNDAACIQDNPGRTHDGTNEHQWR